MKLRLATRSLPALLACLISQGAAAQNYDPVQICVTNLGGYVARVTFYRNYPYSPGWERVSSHDIILSHRQCLSANAGVNIRVVMELFTGVSWAHACTRSYTPATNAFLVMRGTVFQPSCVE